jgi:hypothetical protein
MFSFVHPSFLSPGRKFFALVLLFKKETRATRKRTTTTLNRARKAKDLHRPAALSCDHIKKNSFVLWCRKTCLRPNPIRCRFPPRCISGAAASAAASVLQTRFFVALYGADVKKFYSYRKALLVQEGKDRVRVATAAY